MNKKPSLFSLKDFRGVRFIGGINRTVQAILALTLIFGLNYLASLPATYERWNLNFENRHGIWPETRAQLNELAKRAPADVSPENPWVRLIVTLKKPDAKTDEKEKHAIELLHKQIQHLVGDFKYEAQRTCRPDWIKFETADLVKNTSLNRELESLSKIPPNTAIIVISGKKVRTIDAGSLIKLRPNEKSTGTPDDVVIDGFRGEEAIMSAILSVTDDRTPVAYFLSGNGEARIGDSNPNYGLSAFAQTLRSRNIRTESLDLSIAPDVPADASLVVIADPRVPVSPQAEEKLSRYLRDRNGRALVMIGPGSDCGLGNLFFDWGLLLQDVFVVEKDSNSILAERNIAVRNFPKNPHKTTEILAALKLPIVSSQFRSVEEDLGAKEDRTRTITPLFSSSQHPNALTSWGERDYRKPPYRFDPIRGDIDGPIPLGAVSERVAGTRLGVNILGGRIVVIGSGDIATNAQLENGGNKPFLLNVINWLTDRDVMLNIPPRPISEYRLKATPPDLVHVGWHFVLFPVGLALFGLIVFYWRKRP